MVKSVDTRDLKSLDVRVVPVRFRPRAPVIEESNQRLTKATSDSGLFVFPPCPPLIQIALFSPFFGSLCPWSSGRASPIGETKSAGGLPALSGLVVLDDGAWLSLGLQEMASLIGQVAAATPALAAGVAAVVPGRGRARAVGGGAGNQQELRCYQADFPYFHDVVLYCLACPAAALKGSVKPDTQA